MPVLKYVRKLVYKVIVLMRRGKSDNCSSPPTLPYSWKSEVGGKKGGGTGDAGRHLDQ